MGKILRKAQKRLEARRKDCNETRKAVGPSKAAAYRMPGSMKR